MNTPAPLAPELAYKEDLHGKERTSQLKQAKEKVALEQDVVHNDFKREMLFYRQAQAAVLEGLPRLQSMKVRNSERLKLKLIFNRPGVAGAALQSTWSLAE